MKDAFKKMQKGLIVTNLKSNNNDDDDLTPIPGFTRFVFQNEY